MTEYFDNALYESVDSSLSLMDCDIGAAECHGMLCGMLCGAQHFDSGVWLGHMMGYSDDHSWSDLGSGHALTQLLAETVAGFSADDFALQVLLPSDDHSLQQRTQALGCWCRGFLSGYGLSSDAVDPTLLSDDSQSFLRDLDAIGRVETVDVDEDGDEFAFMEVCEYARMGAMLLREETLDLRGYNEVGGTIH